MRSSRSRFRQPTAHLALVPRGPFRAGRPFWISALLRNPRSGQSVAFSLPDGLTLAKGHTESMPPGEPDAAGYTQMNWLVIPGLRVDGPREICAALSRRSRRTRQSTLNPET